MSLAVRGTVAMTWIALCASCTAGPQLPLAGTWLVRSIDSGDGPRPGAGMHLLVTGTHMWMERSDGSRLPMGDIIRADTSHTPNEIDLSHDGSVGYGIFARDGDKLRLIICDPGLPRPHEFRGTDRGMLFLLQRVSS